MYKTAAIIDNGRFPRKEYPRYLLKNSDYIICCDGALTKYLRNMEAVFGRRRDPDAVIGDLDSLSPAMIRKYEDRIIRETEQENNDQTKAVNHVISHFADVSTIYILGGTGEREDHTIGNLSLLMEYARERDLQSMGINILMVSDFATIFPVTDSTEIECGQGRKISILTPDNSLKIHSEGLEWPLDNVVFDNWWKATLNRATEDTVKLEFSHKSIAIIILD